MRPSHRKHGIGRELLVGLARRCVAQDLARLEWAVLDWNQSAISFYQGMGATVMPDWRIARVTGPALDAFGLGDPPPPA